MKPTSAVAVTVVTICLLVLSACSGGTETVVSADGETSSTAGSRANPAAADAATATAPAETPAAAPTAAPTALFVQVEPSDSTANDVESAAAPEPTAEAHEVTAEATSTAELLSPAEVTESDAVALGTSTEQTSADTDPTAGPVPAAEATAAPTEIPTEIPTVAPTATPTAAPTATPVPTPEPTPTEVPPSEPSPLFAGNFVDLNGQSIGLGDLEGRDVVLWFWAPW